MFPTTHLADVEVGRNNIELETPPITPLRYASCSQISAHNLADSAANHPLRFLCRRQKIVDLRADGNGRF